MGRPRGGITCPESGGAAQEAGGSGLPLWIDRPEAQAGYEGGIRYADLIGHWKLIEADMHEHYGIDLSEPGLLQSRDWRWFKVRLDGLLHIESRLATAALPKSKVKE